MTKTNAWQPITNLLGATAYLLIVVQWLWLSATTLVPLLASDEYQQFIGPQQSTTVTEVVPIEVSIPPAIQIVIAVVSVIFAVGVTLYAIYLVPRTVSRAGHKSVKKAAAVTVSQTTRHQTIKPKQKQALTIGYIWLIKSIAITLPPLLALIPMYGNVGIEHRLVMIVAVFFAGLSLISLGLQLLVGHLAKVPIKNLW